MIKFALIVAGGSGTRMNSDIPKQFIELNGRPVLMHTIEIFKKYDPSVEIVLVLPREHHFMWSELCKIHRFEIKYRLAFGGPTRFDSVFNGLKLLPDEGVVFIHDGVRPLVSTGTIENCFKTTIEKGNALPVIPATESVRIVENDRNYPADRNSVMLVQTPQTFLTTAIKKAYEQAKKKDFTDDASVLESTGEFIHLVPGNRENIKITYPADLAFAETILSRG